MTSPAGKTPGFHQQHRCAVIGRGKPADRWLDALWRAGAQTKHTPIGAIDPRSRELTDRAFWRRALEGCDAVVLAVAPEHRLPIAEKVLGVAADAGLRRLLMEQLFGRTLADARKLLDAAEAAGVALSLPAPQLATLHKAIVAVRRGIGSIPALGPASRIDIAWSRIVARAEAERRFPQASGWEAITTALAFFPGEVRGVGVRASESGAVHTVELHAGGERLGAPLATIRFTSKRSPARTPDDANLVVEGPGGRLDAGIRTRSSRLPDEAFTLWITTEGAGRRRLATPRRYVPAGQKEARRWLSGEEPAIDAAGTLRAYAVWEAALASLDGGGRIVAPPRVVPPPPAGDRRA